MFEKKTTHAGSKSLSPETIKLDTKYALTINPIINKGLTLEAQYKQLIYSIHHLHIDDLEYALYPELSQYGRFHLHGTIKFSTFLAIGRFYNIINYMDINYKFDTISDLKKWDEYVMKSQQLMESIALEFQLPYKLNKARVSEKYLLHLNTHPKQTTRQRQKKKIEVINQRFELSEDEEEVEEEDV